jgi:Protein of unknown function (DUF3800)
MRHLVHYVAYLDEFGHIGPFVSRTHPKFNDSPVSGLAGVVLPASEIREFAIYFFKMKCQLLAWDLVHKNPGLLPAHRWEKKGAAVYTVLNVQRYQRLRQATFRLLNHIKKVGGYVFYTGEHKATGPGTLDSAGIFERQLLQTVQKIDQFCTTAGGSFLLLLDEQQAGNAWREHNVEVCTRVMFDDRQDKCRSLIEPPLQGESHLFQTLQCADWLCALVGRLTAFSVAPEEYADWAIFHKYFRDRVSHVSLPLSGLEPHNISWTAPKPPDLDLSEANVEFAE